MDVVKYLKRIGVDKDIKVDLESLAYLQNQHLLTVPFENLDVINKVHIPLDVKTYYEKIVNNNRGGFCYELNGLFHWLLGKLGFSSYLVAATLYRGEGNWGRSNSHASLIVDLNRPYLVDVGFGNSARKPLPLNGGERKDVSGLYRVIPAKEGYYYKQRKEGGNWRTLYRFLVEERKLSDFEKQCHFVQTFPTSHFTQRRLVTIATEKGRKTLSKDKLTIVENGERREIEVKDWKLASLLAKDFGILDQ